MTKSKIDWPVDMTASFANFAKRYAKHDQAKQLQGDALESYQQVAKRALDEIPPLLKTKQRAVWEIGNRLLVLKNSGIGTKQFDAFVRDAFGISPRTAADWIDVAKAYNVPGEIPDLPKTKLYEEAQKALDKAKRDETPNKRRYKPSATIPALKEIHERLRVMIQRPKSVIPEDPDQRSQVMSLLVEIRQQINTVFEKHPTRQAATDVQPSLPTDREDEAFDDLPDEEDPNEQEDLDLDRDLEEEQAA